MKQDDVRIELVSLEALERWPRNPKRHDEGALTESMERFGFVAPIIVDERTGKIVAGHGRLDVLLAMRKEGKERPARIGLGPLGEWMVPVLRGIHFKSMREAEAYVVADNRQVELGGWDDSMLAGILKELDADGGLAGVGWSADDLDTLVRTLEGPQTGVTPREALAGFQNASIKQIVMYLKATEYDDVVARLSAVAEAEGLKSNTEVVLRLLEVYETPRPHA